MPRLPKLKALDPDSLPPAPVDPPPMVQTLVIKRGDETPKQGTVIETPPGQPNLQVATINPVLAILVRVLRTYIQSVLGFLTIGVTGAGAALTAGVGSGNPLPATDFYHLLLTALGLSVGPAVIALLQNGAELMGELDKLYPKLRS